MGDHSGANATFAAPQDDGSSVSSSQDHFDQSVLSAALARWVLHYGEQGSCTTVRGQRGELRRAG